MDKPGFYKGRHYSTYTEHIATLAQQGQYNELENLLLHLIGSVEAENHHIQHGVVSWPYDLLGLLYQNAQSYTKEIAIYERYARQPYTLDRMFFETRLARARGSLCA
ncbi:hypothetical protein F8S13_09180 [Chloroflexia bacterium SDU3-3]|nr:hypothetical protein F8S13_09180 [Chloroflexia bacterium SDU3-3]